MKRCTLYKQRAFHRYAAVNAHSNCSLLRRERDILRTRRASRHCASVSAPLKCSSVRSERRSGDTQRASRRCGSSDAVSSGRAAKIERCTLHSRKVFPLCGTANARSVCFWLRTTSYIQRTRDVSSPCQSQLCGFTPARVPHLEIRSRFLQRFCSSEETANNKQYL